VEYNHRKSIGGALALEVMLREESLSVDKLSGNWVRRSRRAF